MCIWAVMMADRFSGNQPGTGGLVTFKDSNWLMSIVLAHQPHFANQPADVQVFWGYSLFPDRVGNFVAKPMAECNGAEILAELCGHLRFDLDTVASANCIPCRMPYITSMFMPRLRTDRPLPVPRNSRNFAFISQFVEIADDVVFTVEYSVRARRRWRCTSCSTLIARCPLSPRTTNRFELSSMPWSRHSSEPRTAPRRSRRASGLS